MIKKMIKLFLSTFLILAITSCREENVSPRPFGYFRIDLPEPNYQRLELDCPYSFELSDKVMVLMKDKEKCWINIYYPSHKATIYITYIALDGDLNVQLNQTQQLTYEHQIKATRIDRIPYENSEKDVYGLKYKLDGDVASHLQFYLTDSTHHFIRGALYFDAYVNADSLKPVIEYMYADIQHLIETFEWK